MTKEALALAEHCASKCEACTLAVTAFGPVCQTLKTLIAALALAQTRTANRL